MNKFFIILGLLILNGFVVYYGFINVTNFNDKIKGNERKIDSLNTINIKDKLTIQNLLKQADSSNIKQDKYIAIADSLELLLNKPNIPCPEVVNIQDQEITALRKGLAECNKSKGIYVRTIGIKDNVIANTELILVTNQEMCKSLLKNSKKEKRKGFVLGFLTGLAVGLAIPI